MNDLLVTSPLLHLAAISKRSVLVTESPAAKPVGQASAGNEVRHDSSRTTIADIDKCVAAIIEARDKRAA